MNRAGPNPTLKDGKLTTQPPQRLSRSPHPYFRSGTDVAAVEPAPTAISSHSSRSLRLFTSSNDYEDNEVGLFSDVDGRKRRKGSVSPSESGTEADDEGGEFLKGLPAPPARLRKGLRNSNGSRSGVASPLLTPSYLDDESRRVAIDNQFKRRTRVQDRPMKDEEEQKLQDKLTQRRRAERIRRISEVVLLGAVGFIAAVYDFEFVFHTYFKELLAFSIVLSGTYLVYPIRLILRKASQTRHGNLAQSCLRIRAAFDPAPLLYPVILPVLVALSLAIFNEKVLLPNLVLGLASIPSQFIFLHDELPAYSSTHWLLSATPILTSARTLATTGTQNFTLHASEKIHSPSEQLLLLYPLHQSLTSCLGYLTTTSLLPAELQLLSTSMINVLFLSTSPQVFILKALLWIGGVAIFTLCGAVLRWEVALARIPSWRFRQPRSRIRPTPSYTETLDRYLKKWLVSGGLADSRSESSEAELPSSHGLQRSRTQRASLSIATSDIAKPALADSDVAKSATVSKLDVSNEMYVAPTKSQMRRDRSRTLPSHLSSPSKTPPVPASRPKKDTWNPFAESRWLRSLTFVQATALKWLLAAYTYSVVLITITTVIRLYVRDWALRGHEPVGWALGYLFGDLQFFRRFTVAWKLQQWICLPQSQAARANHFDLGWADRYRELRLGAANTRLLMCVYCVGVIGIGLAVVFRLTASVEVDTRRKVFHGMMVVMFLPLIYIDPAFCALALILVLAIFLLLDLFRASQLPPLSRPLTYFLAPYVDGRDHRGPVIVSHIFLLIGCAVPFWLSLAAIERTGIDPWEGWDVSKRDLSMVSGVICVGMGDAAASLFGRRFGRRRWCWSGGKSLEGSLAFAVAVVAGLVLARFWILLGGWAGDSGDPWAWTIGKAMVAATGASLTEAILTGGNDNVVVPVILWLLVRGLKM